MPGRLNEKISLYEATYQGIVSEICDKPYEWLKQNGYIDFTSTSYLRGMTYRDCTIIVDECQNMSEAEIHTVMTRVGEGCRVIFCGDFFQKDYMKESSGINTLLKIASKMRSFEIIQFSKEDVVRSGFVREYIFSRLELEEQGAL
jgi:phosphate starvation-inducible protein PhoH